MIQEEPEQYQNDSECEDYQDYGPQGYHPVVLGEKFNQKYIVVQKLGWGHFSTVWLVRNQTNSQYAALKIQRSKDTHAESALDQLQILSESRKHQSDPSWLEFINNKQSQHANLIKSKLCRPLLLLDNFPHYGIHGKHYCSAFEILGPNLLDVIQHYQFQHQKMPLWLVKKIAIDVLLGLVYLHDHCKIIHTDLKPENIMIKLEDREEKELIEQIKAYKVKPISMKFLKNLQSSKNSKNKKKKLKKKAKKAEQEIKNEGESNPIESQGQIHSVSSNIQDEQSSSTVQQNKQEKQIKDQTKQVEESVKHVEDKAQQKSQKVEVNDSQQKTNEKQTWDPVILKWKSVIIDLNYNIFFKIVDLGNACFEDKHFTQGIQTRQYRAPQVILGHPYYPNTDIWSLGCTIFELLTSNFLFKPKKIQGIPKDEDHLYKMIEVLGPMSKEFATGGTQSAEYFNKKGKLIHGHPKETIPISKLLIEDYGYEEQEAKDAEQFLMPLLAYEPAKRISAKGCLQHPWLWK